MKYRMFAMLATCLMVGGVLADVTLTHEGAGFSFDVPDDWEGEVSEEDPNLLIVNSPGNQIVLQSWVIEAEDIDAAIDGVVEGLDEQFEDLKLDEEVEEQNVNDLDRVALHGSAKLEGQSLLLSIVIVIAEKPVIFLAMASPEVAEANAELLQGISSSIRVAE